MSNEFSIAAVTLILHDLLKGIENIKDSEGFNQLPADLKPTQQVFVETLPLDKAYEFSTNKNQVNLFLYHVEYNAAWRNMNLPGLLKPGETGHPPLPLNLYYIITAYGENGSELIGHLLLGKAMSILHDHAVLGRKEIKDICKISGLHNQVERLRITPQPISLDEVSKLWAGFQTQYRLSAAYEVAVVLIESKHQAKTPLPVLIRGGKNADGDEKGVLVSPTLILPFPTLEDVTPPPKNEPGALLGDQLVLTGHHLAGDTVKVRFTHPLLATPHEITVAPGDRSETQVTVQLPIQPDQWPAGFYKIAVLITKAGEQDRTTNEIPLVLMPGIILPILITLEASPVGYRMTVTCSPEVWPDQRASLLLGDREFNADDHPSQTDKLKFFLADVSPGTYFVRLRIDGVDTPLIDRSKEPPVFTGDINYKVTIP
jgi:hypothetical protein